MEERVPPSVGHEPPLPPPPPSPPAMSKTHALPPLSPPPQPRPLPSETYIVQVPRDQIYRVPPPENAIIAQSLRDGGGNEKKRCGCRPSCLCILIWVVTIAIIVGIILGVLHFIVINPKSPQFSITKMAVLNSQPAHKNHHSQISYDISMKADNPNGRMGVSYESGDAKLSLKQHGIGGGEFPSFSQKAEESRTIHISMTGLDSGLPKEVTDSMEDSKSDKPLSFGLVIDARIKVKIFLFIPSSKDMRVTCDFMVNTLAQNSTKVLSQECRTNT